MEGINLGKLESVVEKMIKNINELKNDKEALIAQLAARNATIAELEAKLNSMTTNQEEINFRVSSLLNSIEDWERSADTDSDPQEIPADQSKTRDEGSLFSIGD